jgi:hypothetical protein
MDEATVAKLRRQEALHTLPDGSEAIPVTLQYRGVVPPLPRQERKQWLRERFARLYGDLRLNLETISPSAQTVDALFPVARFREIREQVEANEDRVDVVKTRQAQLGA